MPGHRGAVVLFHGGHLRAGLPLSEAALVDAGYTVLTPSRPGHGQVGWDHAEQLSLLPRATTWASPSLSHLIWYGSGGRRPPSGPRTS